MGKATCLLAAIVFKIPGKRFMRTASHSAVFGLPTLTHGLSSRLTLILSPISACKKQKQKVCYITEGALNAT